jgi:diaminopimelate decarboxylase/aspartate kinase
VLGPCTSVSLVGRNIRAILHKLGEAFELFAEQRIYLLSQAANDLNFTFVVDENQGDRLVNELHERLIEPVPQGTILGPTWQELFAPTAASRVLPPTWWRARRESLIALAATHDCAYVYDLQVVRDAAETLLALKSVDRVLYAMKANPNPAILAVLAGLGVGFDCVSRGEIEHLLNCVPGLRAPAHPVHAQLCTAFGVRVGAGAGHHPHHRQPIRAARMGRAVSRPQCVPAHRHRHRTRPSPSRAHRRHACQVWRADCRGCGNGAIDADRFGVAVVGLHAHSGSGIFDADNWSEVAGRLLDLGTLFPQLQCIDVGGGLGVADGQEHAGLDMRQLDTVLLAARQNRPGIALWIEPGRYLVAGAGALIARVTQTKSKDDVHYVGVATGMNSLIRPRSMAPGMRSSICRDWTSHRRRSSISWDLSVKVPTFWGMSA